MNDFIVSAIKYRPATFHSVVGQPSIVNTLKNAVAQRHLAHAYLFCGPRGVGKTTCARIFAKALNCTQLTDKTEPCNTCESCQSFNENRSYNIHELDAASNNKVDDIRQLIDQVRIPPQVGRYSVYIIDEVHMLSPSAFNAFLKTLEEPPKHAIFILATTEKHKIIPTILSRCQIFDFNRIRVEDIVKHLEYVASQENIEAESEALNVVAIKADGAMRDALSIFDQIVSFSGNKITYQNTIANLNVLDYDYYFQMIDAILEMRSVDTLLLFNSILERGFDAQYFLSGIALHLRDLLVSLNEKSLSLLEVGDSVKAKYKEQAKKSSLSFLFQALDIMNRCDLDYRISRNKRLHVELALLKLCSLAKKKKSDDITPDSTPVASIVGQKKENKDTGQSKPITKEIPTGSTTKTYSKPQDKLEEKTVEPPKRKTSMPSVSIKAKREVIAQTKRTKATEINIEENLELGEDTFTIAEAQEKLDKFISEGSLDERTKVTLTAFPLDLISGHILALKVSNSLEIEHLQKNIPAIESRLIKELNNKNIKIQLIEPKQEDRSIKAMGDKDKLKYLAEKNSSILTLKKELALEFE